MKVGYITLKLKVDDSQLLAALERAAAYTEGIMTNDKDPRLILGNATNENDPRLFLEQAAQVLEDNDNEVLAEQLRSVSAHFRNLRHVAALVSTAAAKHTGAAARARAGTPDPGDINRDAVGRLHNAAKNARRSLDGGACATCKEAGDAGVDVTDREGEKCLECGRLLGLL